MKYNLRKIMLEGLEDLPEDKRDQLCRSTPQSMAFSKSRGDQRKTDPAEQSGRRHCRRGKHLGGLETERLRSAARYKSAVQLLPHLGKQGRRSHI